MPVHQGKDAQGCFYQWGDHGKKYYYTPSDIKSREAAKQSAGRQGRAAFANGWKGK